MEYGQDLLRKFWEQVTITDECWYWNGDTRGPYGVFSLGKRRKRIGAHVFAWLATGGTIPLGHEVHHTCEVKLCVCPRHLRCLSSSDHARQHRAQEGPEGNRLG